MIEKINHYSLTTPASVYDEEALTALELAGRTAAKVNEVVGDQNDLRQETEQTLDKFENKTIPAEVKDEFNKNLNNGTFDQSIGKYIGNIEQRVDNLVENLPEGSTTMDAELIDIRVDEYGTTYDSAGAGVRGQVRDVNHKLHSSPYKAAGTRINMTVNPNTGVVHLQFFGLLSMKTKQGANARLWSDMITDIAANCNYNSSQPDNVLIEIPAHTVLTYNLATSKLRMIYTGAHINSIRNNDIILFHNAWGEPMGGALLDIITRDRVAACEAKFGTLPKHDVQSGAMYISQSGTCTVLGKGDTGAVELTFSKPLVARIGSIQEGLDWTTVTEHVPATVNGEACTVTIQAYNALVFNVTEKKLRVRSAVDKILPDDFILIQASYAAVIGGYLYPQMNKPNTGSGSTPADLNILFFDSVDDLPADLPDGTMAGVPCTKSVGGGLPVLELTTPIRVFDGDASDATKFTETESALLGTIGKAAFMLKTSITWNIGGEDVFTTAHVIVANCLDVGEPNVSYLFDASCGEAIATVFLNKYENNNNWYAQGNMKLVV